MTLQNQLDTEGKIRCWGLEKAPQDENNLVLFRDNVSLRIIDPKSYQSYAAITEDAKISENLFGHGSILAVSKSRIGKPNFKILSVYEKEKKTYVSKIYVNCDLTRYISL